MSKLLVETLSDWCRKELRTGKRHPSIVHTNITYKKEGLNRAVSSRVGKNVDAYKYIDYRSPQSFEGGGRFWDTFEDGSLIIIDEVHKCLSSDMDYASMDLEKDMIRWLSTHRHQQQHVYLLTQHTDQAVKSILGVADELMEVVNLKSLVLPFPISIKMSDVYVVMEAFGIQNQYYQVNMGNYRGKAVNWGGMSERCVMVQEIFDVYQSHASGKTAHDSPPLDLSPVEGVMWFARRHAWHLVIKVGLVLGLVIGFPMILTNVVSATVSGSTAATAIKSNSESPSPASPPSPPVFTPPARAGAAERTGGTERVETKGEREEKPTPALSASAKEERKVVMNFNEGVIFNDGTKIKIGEAVEIGGKTETLALSCTRCGVVAFESGKKVRL
jgi:hypothetical protein